MTPNISIIVPVFNVAHYLDACLVSLRQQTIPDIEIICVDDASSDSSGRLLESAARQDSRVLILKHAINRGLSAARNTGLQAARGPWVLFIDSDDLASSHLCERVLNAANVHAADAVFFNYAVFTDGQTPPPEPAPTVACPVDRCALLHRPAFAWSKFVRTDLMRTRDIAFPEGLCFEDIPVHWRLVIESQRPVFLDDPLVWYRQRAGAITSRTDWSFADGILTYDLVKDYLQSTSRWEEWKDIFLGKQLATFARAHAYYVLTNPILTQRVRQEALARMTSEYWNFVQHGEGLSRWERDYLLSCCRPEDVNNSSALLLSTFRHHVRERLRLSWHRLRGLGAAWFL